TGNKERWMEMIANVKVGFFLQGLKDVLVVENADDAVQFSLIYWNPRKAALNKALRNFLQRGVDFEGVDFGTRHHHSFHRRVGKFEDAVDQFLLRFVENSLGRPFPNQKLHFIDRDKAGSFAFFAAENPEHGVARRRQSLYQGRADSGKEINERCSEAGDALGKAERQRLRNEFPQD